MFMFDDDNGSRLVVLAVPWRQTNAPMTQHAGDGVAGFSWSDGGSATALSEMSLQTFCIRSPMRRAARYAAPRAWGDQMGG